MEQKIFQQKSKEDVLYELRNHPSAYHRYLGLDDTQKELFMTFCTGKKTLPVLYDSVFKRLLHPDVHPERLEDCISCILNQTVHIKGVLPTEDILMDGETSMVMDILVELDNRSLVLVEIQKVPYYFPAERASCYSADLLLRQYSRVKNEKGKLFSYKDLSKVYTIILYAPIFRAVLANNGSADKPPRSRRSSQAAPCGLPQTRRCRSHNSRLPQPMQ